MKDAVKYALLAVGAFLLARQFGLLPEISVGAIDSGDAGNSGGSTGDSQDDTAGDISTATDDGSGAAAATRDYEIVEKRSPAERRFAAVDWNTRASRGAVTRTGSRSAGGSGR